MEGSTPIYVKLVILLLTLMVAFYYLSLQINHTALTATLKSVYKSLNKSQLTEMFVPVSTHIIADNNTNTTFVTTSTTNRPTTIDPTELIVERPPSASRLQNKGPNTTLVAFCFQTKHHILADLQLYLIRKLATDLVALELFTDGQASEEMRQVAEKHKAELHSYPTEKHPKNGPSDRNTNVVNWALSTRAKRYLGNNTAILLLDGDVFPLSLFDSTTLLNSRDMVCRKHPASFARYCWIGFICISPHLYYTIHDFDVSQDWRPRYNYDSGGKTAEYLVKYENVSFSWMYETIFLKPDKDLFWGAVDGDIQWILQNFGRCDKCGPEIFFSPFENSNAVFYHMISATSEWRFGHQAPRRQSISDSIMQSPYGPNQTYSLSDLTASVKKVQKMEAIPFFGNLTCQRVCGR